MMSIRCTAAALALAAAGLFPSTAAAQAPAAPAQPFTAGWQDGFFIQTANGDYRLLFGLVAQMDGRFSLDDPPPITNTFTIRKVRPTLLRPGRAGTSTSRSCPTSATARRWSWTPTSTSASRRSSACAPARTRRRSATSCCIGDAFLLFPERSLASSLVPNRDIGVQVQGDLAGGKLFYAGGVFNGVPDGSEHDDRRRHEQRQGPRRPHRRAAVPLDDATPGRPLNGLGFQLGGSTGKQTGALPSFRTSVGQTYFSYARRRPPTATATRVSPAVFYYYKAFGAFAEYMRSTQAVIAGRRRHATSPTTAWDVTGVVSC